MVVLGFTVPGLCYVYRWYYLCGGIRAVGVLVRIAYNIKVFHKTGGNKWGKRVERT